MDKPVDQRSRETSSEDARIMRFSDEASVAEVARLMGQVRRVPTTVSGFGGLPGNESGATTQWLR